MYSQLSMVGELATNHCKSLGTHRTLGLVSRIDGMKSMEGDPLNESNEVYLIIQHEVQIRILMIWRKSDKEHVHKPTTLCIFYMCQMKTVHVKHPMNSIQ
jgi:hypothetical protein